MRPKSIAWFERLFLTSLAGAVARVAIVLSPSTEWRLTSLILTVLLVSVLLNLTLVLFVSRRRSQIAKWILTGLFLIGLTSYLGFFEAGILHFEDWAEIAVSLVQGVALGLLFTPSARAWMAAPRSEPRSAETLGRTFE
jgi:hypothetical protein